MKPRPPRNKCHALECKRNVPRHKLMCHPHWLLVPREIQERVCAAYTPGQEKLNGKSSNAWVVSSRAAIKAVALQEGTYKHMSDEGPIGEPEPPPSGTDSQDMGDAFYD